MHKIHKGSRVKLCTGLHLVALRDAWCGSNNILFTEDTVVRITNYGPILQ